MSLATLFCLLSALNLFHPLMLRRAPQQQKWKLCSAIVGLGLSPCHSLVLPAAADLEAPSILGSQDMASPDSLLLREASTVPDSSPLAGHPDAW